MHFYHKEEQDMFHKTMAIFLIGLSTLVWISGCTTERVLSGRGHRLGP